ncbi:hypothetical protein HHI36_022648 [Cryptolaemus montrouzieri]|uniref:Uncharacterized protein n=1 Tax=Cryptolaemus montrouzieri TaxID=559131 RepID=A0ABD2N1K9_9CUCU
MIIGMFFMRSCKPCSFLYNISEMLSCFIYFYWLLYPYIRIQIVFYKGLEFLPVRSCGGQLGMRSLVQVGGAQVYNDRCVGRAIKYEKRYNEETDEKTKPISLAILPYVKGGTDKIGKFFRNTTSSLSTNHLMWLIMTLMS